MDARIVRINTGVATVQGVQVHLDWPEGATVGRLHLTARRVDAPGLGYAFRDVDWNCALTRHGWNAWACDGMVGQPGAAPSRLAMDLQPDSLQGTLSQGRSRLDVHRDGRTPDLTSLDLTQVPVQWANVLVARAVPSMRMGAGVLDGRLAITTPKGGPLDVRGPLALRGGAFQTADGTVAAENLNLALQVVYRDLGEHAQVTLDGTALGDVLAGKTFVSIAGTPAQLHLSANGGKGGWRFDDVRWRDGATLSAQGRFSLDASSNLHGIDITFDSPDASGLRDRYLSGALALFGLSDITLRGALSGHVQSGAGDGLAMALEAEGVDIDDPGKRLALHGLRGDVRYSPGARVDSVLRWDSGALYGVDYGPGTLPFRSENGQLALKDTARIPLYDGLLRIDHLRIAPPSGTQGLRVEFGLGVEHLDFGKLSAALGLPAFRGTLTGTIPSARFADDLLTLDGGLDLSLFEGSVRFSSLSIERPFGTAPTLVGDIDMHGLDLLRLTEVLGFGSITGRLDGYIHDLRLVDWSPVRFDADLHTVPVPGVRQRISQRAVQNISSVGGHSFTGSLQGKAISLFKDFGYRRIGVRCRLVNTVCVMGGLKGASTPRSDSSGFTIVEGAGLPHLTVVGYNRQVDWPTLVERLKAVATGDVKPVFEK